MSSPFSSLCIWKRAARQTAPDGVHAQIEASIAMMNVTSVGGSWRTQLGIFIFLFLFRLLNAQYVQTFFQPDEYFQSLEPAWQWAFGSTSGAWITWEWKEHLRSSMHPLLFSGLYQVVDLVCDYAKTSRELRTHTLVNVPRFLQAMFAALMDLFTYRLATKLYGSNLTSLTALGLTILSPWQWFCSTRTFSNSMEASLTAVALDLFPWSWFTETKTDHEVDILAYTYMQLSLTAAAIACILRPTNVIIWITISTILVSRVGLSGKSWTLVECAFLIGCAVLAVSSAMDKMFFSEWTFPPLRFLYFNLVQSLAVFYGTNRIDYYFTEGIPLLLTTALPFGIVGLWKALQSGASSDHTPANTARGVRFTLASAALASVICLTIVAHKEVRFIYPLLPILHVLAAGPIRLFFDQSAFAKQKRKLPLGSTVRTILLFALLILNVVIAGYVSMYHQRGVVDVMHYLRHKQEARADLASKYNISSEADTETKGAFLDMTVAFLMPCHSTPWRSHLVYPQIDAWALTCEPPIDTKPEKRASYLDEADQFYADPAVWIEKHMRSRYTISESADPNVEWDKLASRKKRKWPQYLVFFEHLEPTMQQILVGSQYRECERFFNSHWHDDWRRQGDVVVWCLRQS